MSKRLSIITICYNDRAGLERTFASVFGQSIREFDYIVVDGGSTDGSVELIEKHKDRLTKWVSEKDAGIYEAQNKGWRFARTPFVLFMNAGDTFASPDVLENALPRLQGEVGILYGDSLLTDQNGARGKKEHPAAITSAYLMKETIAHQSQFIKKDILEAMGGYDTHFRIAADYAFLARAFWEHGARMEHLGFVVGCFDMEGMSSRPDQKAAAASERKEIQARYAPKFWFHLYHAYAAVNRVLGR